MFRFDERLTVYLHRAPVDFRLNINGLAALVQHALGRDPFAPTLYVFSNRRRDRAKILVWDRNGFWLLLKRLEEVRFIWPDENSVPTLTVEQLHWLLEGIDVGVFRRHPQRVYAILDRLMQHCRRFSLEGESRRTGHGARAAGKPHKTTQEGQILS